MWGRKRQAVPSSAEARQPSRLREAIREARIENAERSAVVVDLQDAEAARLEILNDALDPLFAEIPDDVDLFDRGISCGDTPRLWIDAVAHVAMGRDKRLYRFVQDTRYGRKVLVESFEVDEIVADVTRYVAHRLLERERAFSEDPGAFIRRSRRDLRALRRTRRMLLARAFLFGLVVGVLALFAFAWWYTSGR